MLVDSFLLGDSYFHNLVSSDVYSNALGVF